MAEPSALYRIAEGSPAVLAALRAHEAASASSVLPPEARRAIALRVAELEGCAYLSRLAALEAGRAGADAERIDGYRRGVAPDRRTQTLLGLASKVVRDRGRHFGCALSVASEVGLSEREVVECLALVGLESLRSLLASAAGLCPETLG